MALNLWLGFMWMLLVSIKIGETTNSFTISATGTVLNSLTTSRLYNTATTSISVDKTVSTTGTEVKSSTTSVPPQSTKMSTKLSNTMTTMFKVMSTSQETRTSVTGNVSQQKDESTTLPVTASLPTLYMSATSAKANITVTSTTTNGISVYVTWSKTTSYMLSQMPKATTVNSKTTIMPKATPIMTYPTSTILNTTSKFTELNSRTTTSNMLKATSNLVHPTPSMLITTAKITIVNSTSSPMRNVTSIVVLPSSTTLNTTAMGARLHSTITTVPTMVISTITTMPSTASTILNTTTNSTMVNPKITTMLNATSIIKYPTSTMLNTTSPSIILNSSAIPSILATPTIINASSTILNSTSIVVYVTAKSTLPNTTATSTMVYPSTMLNATMTSSMFNMTETVTMVYPSTMLNATMTSSIFNMTETATMVYPSTMLNATMTSTMFNMTGTATIAVPMPSYMKNSTISSKYMIPVSLLRTSSADVNTSTMTMVTSFLRPKITKSSVISKESLSQTQSVFYGTSSSFKLLVTMVSSTTSLLRHTTFESPTPASKTSVMRSSVVVSPSSTHYLIAIDADCTEVTKYSSNEFKNAVKHSISVTLGIDKSRITILDVKCGSIYVTLEIKDAKKDNITGKLNNAVARKELKITYNGKKLLVTSAKVVSKPSKPKGDSDDDNTALIVYIVFGVVLGLVLLIGIVALVIRCRNERSAGMFQLPREDHLELSGFSRGSKSQFRAGNFYGDGEIESGEGEFGHNRPGSPIYGENRENHDYDTPGTGLPEWKNLPTIDLSEAGIAEQDSSATNVLLTYENKNNTDGKVKHKESIGSYENPSMDNVNGNQDKQEDENGK